MASMANTPASVAAATTSWAPARVEVNAFSTSTAFPAAIAARAMSRCCGCVVAM